MGYKKPDFVPEDNQALPVGHKPDLTRRDFIKQVASRVGAVLATAGLGHEIVGGPLWAYLDSESVDEAEAIPEHEAIEMLEQAEAHIANEAEKAVQTVEKLHPELSEHEKALKAIDYLGCGVFAYGVSSLLSGGHIAALHYGMFTAVMSAKYALSTDEERHHLVEEFKSSAKAGLIIGGTVALAEGIRADLDTAYTKIASRPLENTDRTAMLTMLSATVSPAITTVGAATLAKDMAAELAGGDQDKAAVLMQYVSNSSGFLLFGDPPFIAVCEKYGFKEGVLWQMRTMWPMAIYSLFSSALKLNGLRAKTEAPEGVNSTTWAIKETKNGMLKNLPVLKTIIFASLKNTAKFYTGVDKSGLTSQDQEGLILEIDKTLEEKFNGVAKLFKGEMDSSAHHEDVEGLHGDSEQEAAAKQMLNEGISFVLDKAGQEDKLSQFHAAIQDSDFEKIEELSAEIGLDPSSITPLLHAARRMQTEHTPKDPDETKRPWRTQAFDYVNYLTDLNNVKGALGHNLGDIVDVFPFQAGCVPFLTTGFKDIRNHISQFLDSKQLESLFSGQAEMKDRTMEALMFVLIMAFSSVADNYVACKIGLDLFPDKPEVALVPSIIGGGMSSVGNMANLALFNLEQMPLATSFAKDYWHLDIAAFGLVWTQVLRDLQKTPLLNLVFGSGMQAGKSSAH